MSRILILHASIDGQTAKIARRIAAVLAEGGHAVTLRAIEAIEALWEIDRHDAVMIGGSIRYGHYSRSLEDFVRAHLARIEARPNAFFSVCLSAGGPGAKPAVAEGYVAQFRARTGWHPEATASFAGALLYRKYRPFIRFMMRLIVGVAGGDRDTSRDYEYTDWKAVDRFAGELASRLAVAKAA